MRVATIIPTYNERKNIMILVPEILEVFKKEAIDGRVIIVDDASPDGTGRAAKKLAKNSDRVFILQRPKKMGIGSAYKDGFKYALSKGCVDTIEMDADLSHNPAYIPEFTKKLREGYDLIIGSRYVPGGRIPKWSLFRRLVSNFTNTASRFFLGLIPSDVTSGYRAYSYNALRKIDFSSVKADGYAFQVEMVVRCQRAGLKICEIPIAFVDREKGESKLSIKEMWIFFRSMIRLAFIRK